MSSSDKSTLDGLDDLMKQFLLNYVMVPGYIYMTEDSSFNPNTAWGGTWQKIEGRMLIGANSSYPIGTTGGSTTSGGSGSLTSGGSGDLTSGGPSTNTSGSTAISVANLPQNYARIAARQLGASSRGIYSIDGTTNGTYSDGAGYSNFALGSTATYSLHTITFTGSGTGHTHTLSSHTHTTGSHTHTIDSHTHSVTPPYEAVNIWKRIS